MAGHQTTVVFVESTTLRFVEMCLFYGVAHVVLHYTLTL